MHTMLIITLFQLLSGFLGFNFILIHIFDIFAFISPEPFERESIVYNYCNSEHYCCYPSLISGPNRHSF